MDSIRRTLVHLLIMPLLLLGVDLVCNDDQVRADRASCDQIKAACQNAGFVLGGGARNGLLVDCFQPIVQGTAQPKSASRPLPSIDPHVVNACRERRDAAPVAVPVHVPLVPAADGQTVYDPVAQVTWLADANLAAKQTFDVADINPDGSMEHAAAVEWIAAMNKADGGRGYLGKTNWQMPETGPPDPSCSLKGTTGFDCTGSAMGELFYKRWGLHRGESVVAVPDVKVGPFHNIQPYLYWACEAETAGSACQSNGPAERFEWNFSFGNGFEGTNLLENDLYVIVYHADTN